MNKKVVKKVNYKNIFILIMAFIFLVFILINFVEAIQNNYNYNKLKDSNYSTRALNAIASNDIIAEVSSHDYSAVIDEAIVEDDFAYDKLDLYFSINYVDYSTYGSDLNTLIKVGYPDDDLLLLYQKLTGDELSLLTTKGYINNITNYAVYTHFKLEKMERYLAYQAINTSYSLTQVISYVNLGLDIDFYSDITEIEDPTRTLVLVNKNFKLPDDYQPENILYIASEYANQDLLLRSDAKLAFDEMAAAAANAGLDLRASSAFRSDEYQEELYSYYADKDGIEVADTYSARPGHSEHQTGLAVDVSSGNNSITSFGSSNEYSWVLSNANLYGYIIRYTEDNEFITGFKAEPWHLRYVGVEVATFIKNNDITFDEYYAEYIDIKK